MEAERRHERRPVVLDPVHFGAVAQEGIDERDLRTRGVRVHARHEHVHLPGDRLTHIIYAFARIKEDGSFALGDPCLDVGQCNAAPDAPLPVTDRGNFAELRRLRERYPNLKLMIAAGGWTGSGRFSDIALTSGSKIAHFNAPLYTTTGDPTPGHTVDATVQRHGA